MSSPVWTPLGPACVLNGSLATTGSGTCSGRITSIAIDPANPDQIVYAGTPEGGVWKTADGGLNWFPKSDNQETLRIGCITIDLGPLTRIILGTGDFDGSQNGVGVLVSADGGDTWQRLPAGDLFKTRRIARVLLDPADSKHWYAATSGGLFETPDNGVTWTEILVGPRLGLAACDAVMDVSNPAQIVLYVALTGRGVFRRIGTTGSFLAIAGSPDFGNQFGRIALSLSAKSPATLYAALDDPSQASINAFATDKANAAQLADISWQKRGSIKDNTQNDYNLLLAVAPDNPRTVFLGGTMLFRSLDGGKTWEFVGSSVHSDQHVIAFHPTKPATMWLGNDGGMWYSTDGGTTWAHRNRGLETLQLYAIAQHPADESVILGGSQDNGGFRFEGSAPWLTSQRGDVLDTIVDPDDPHIWYLSATGGPQPLLRSGSSGAPGSYKEIIKGLVGFDTGRDVILKLRLDPATHTLYATSNRIYTSTDRGDTWKVVKTGTGATLAEFKTPHVTTPITALGITSGILYVAAIANFWVLTQSGGTYSIAQLPGPLGTTGFFIADIAVDPTSPTKLYVVVRENPAGHLFRSDDGGRNWQSLTLPSTNSPVTGLPAELTRSALQTVAIDPDNPTHVYAGGEAGVFVSIDGGATWDWWNQNLPNVAVSRLVVYKTPRLMRAATFGRGVWERPLDPSTGTLPNADIYLRDNALDLDRRGATSGEGKNPFDPKTIEKVFTGADLKVDNDSFKYLPPFTGGFEQPKSTVDYTPGGAIDFIGFHEMPNRGPRHGADAKVYLQVNNRGPKPANNVQARLFWANKDGDAFPDLPADFWTAFPGSDPSDISTWHPIGPAQTIGVLRPAEPQVLTFPWPSDGISNPVGVLAVITSPDDPIQESGRSIAAIVAANNHILLKELSVGLRSAFIVLGVVAAVGLLAFGGYELLNREL
jgi:photosystem II stability/assembly factor-like uncharacterized protein